MDRVTPPKKKLLSRIFGNRLTYTLFSLLVVVLGSYFAIQYARGNWRVTDDGVAVNTGLLNANSFPNGAQVFVNDKLITATDDTIYLNPDIYQVRIVKEGYSTWQKELSIQKELVTQTNATLFPIAPSITPLTFTGVSNIHPSPDGQKVLFYVNEANPTSKNGFYVLELTSNLLSLQNGPKQITDDVPEYQLATAHVIWSPDSNEVMVLLDESLSGKEFLLDISKKTNLLQELDISYTRKNTLSAWEEEIYQKERQYLAKFPDEIIEVATTSAKNVYISPDKKRILYTATASSTLAEDLIPPIPATSNQAEERNLIPGNIYVYDREEDKNFRVLSDTERPYLSITDLLNGQATASAEMILPIKQTETELMSTLIVDKYVLSDDLDQLELRQLDASPEAFLRLQATDHENKMQTAINFANYYTGVQLNSLQWFPDSKHLLYVSDNKIHIMEYDGQNNTVIYSGPFAEEFVYPWPDGSKLIINTSFSPDSPFNLYAITLK